MYSSVEIAGRFYELSGQAMTDQRKMQGLVYLAHAAHLAHFNEPLVSSRFEAQHFGPTCPVLWRHHVESGSDFPAVALSEEADAIIKPLWGVLRWRTMRYVVDLTIQPHQPWERVYFGYGVGAPINNDLIKEAYLNAPRKAKQGIREVGQ